jgi:hypothetical protein
MTIQKCLFVGGVRDGDLINIDTATEWTSLPDPIELSAARDGLRAGAAVETTMLATIYRRWLMRPGGERAPIYVYFAAAELVGEDVLGRLIARYSAAALLCADAEQGA